MRPFNSLSDAVYRRARRYLARSSSFHTPNTSRSFSIAIWSKSPSFLGVLLDSELTMKRHVNRTVIAPVSIIYEQRLRQLRRHVDIDTMKQLVSAFIFSRLDYYNAVLYGLPQSTVSPLQRVQNAAARVTLGLSPRDHVRLALKEPHWLSK